MKKIFALLSIFAVVFLFVGARMPVKDARNVSDKDASCGYRIIEFGIGVNCNGDTIKLERTKGFQRSVSAENISHAAS